MDSTPADNPVFREQYAKYLKTVIDPSRAYSFEEFSKIDNLKKQYLADPKNFRFDLPYSAGRRTFPATEKIPRAQVSPNVGKVLIAEKIKGPLSEAEERNVKKLSPADVRKAPIAERYKAAENASIERGAKGLEENLVSPTAEKYKAALTEGEKKMARSILSGNIGKTAEDFADPNKFYRVFSGNEAYQDILDSGKIRTIGSPTYKGANQHLLLSENPSLADRLSAGRPTAWPSFAKGKANVYFAKGLPDHYIIETEEKLMTPSRGRHSPGSTYFPIDKEGLPVDETKTKIYKHLGEGKYEQVLSANKNIEKDLIKNIEKNVIRTAPEVTSVGKGLGAIARGAGKVASKLAGPVGAVLTAVDLGQALSEVQDKGAAKIAEDYKKEQEMKALAESENMGDNVMEKMKSNYKQYSPEERMKLKEMLSKYRANAALRSGE
jgi:uncharacterized protein YaaW (UPF0174 family)